MLGDEELEDIVGEIDKHITVWHIPSYIHTPTEVEY